MKYMELKDKINRYKKRFIMYFFVGGFGALINWAAFYLLITYAHIPYIPAAILAFILSCYINFLLCRKVFAPSERKKTTEFLLIIFVSTLAAALDIAAMTFLIEVLKCDVMLSKILGTGVSFVFNYTARQFYIYKEKPKCLNS